MSARSPKNTSTLPSMQLLHVPSGSPPPARSSRRLPDFCRRPSSQFSDVVPVTTAKVIPSSTFAAGEPRHTGRPRRACASASIAARAALAAASGQHDRANAAGEHRDRERRRPCAWPASRWSAHTADRCARCDREHALSRRPRARPSTSSAAASARSVLDLLDDALAQLDRVAVGLARRSREREWPCVGEVAELDEAVSLMRSSVWPPPPASQRRRNCDEQDTAAPKAFADDLFTACLFSSRPLRARVHASDCLRSLAR